MDEILERLQDAIDELDFITDCLTYDLHEDTDDLQSATTQIYDYYKRLKNKSKKEEV